VGKAYALIPSTDDAVKESTRISARITMGLYLFFLFSNISNLFQAEKNKFLNNMVFSWM
jgi:hypothetical protein